MTSGTALPLKSTLFRYFIAILSVGVTGVACTTEDLREGSVTSTHSDTSQTAQRVENRAQIIAPTGEGLKIEVTRVSDGDSLRATSSEGDLEIRLLGVNAPERGDCFGAESSYQLEALVAEGDVTMYPWPGETDQYGRELGLLVAGDTFVNLSLVETGHVVARAQSDHGFDAEFEAAERTASNAGVGLWAADACGAASEAELVIVDVKDNPPGDDRENPNGEWVDIENLGDAVSLFGWVLRDESTRHRYSFPNIEVSPGATVRVHTGCGDDELGGSSIVLYWCDPEPPVWNNGGDTAFLLDPNGAVADSYNTQG